MYKNKDSKGRIKPGKCMKDLSNKIPKDIIKNYYELYF